jgi:tetratricopeptide (TPR) repeat protein
MKIRFTSKTSARVLAVVTALMLAGNALALPEAQFQPAFEQFMRANSGDESAIEKAANAFTDLLKAEPGNPVLMAYAGAATSMKANTTWMPWKKMAYADDGMALLDKALTLLSPAHDAVLQNHLPAVLEVRFVASNTFLAVPGFMNRGARGAKLLSEVLNNPLFAASPLAFRADVWLAAARLAAKEKRLDEARNYLNQVIQANAPQAEAARAQLKALAS